MRYVFDIDGTILNSDKDYNLLDFDEKIVEKINKLYSNGHVIIIWTGRHWDKLQKTKDQLKKIGVRYTTLLMAKPSADLYIDDKAIAPETFHELYDLK